MYSCSLVNTPKLFQEELSRSLIQDIRKAEMNTLRKNNIYKLFPLPEVRMTMDRDRLIFMIKANKNDEGCYKARFVVKGYLQIH